MFDGVLNGLLEDVFFKFPNVNVNEIDFQSACELYKPVRHASYEVKIWLPLS